MVNERTGKPSTNGVKPIVKKEFHTPTKFNGTMVKRDVDKSPVQKKEASSSGVKTVVKKTVKTEVKVTHEKKVFSLPGQKHDPPEERDPLRIFYETLHEQIPGSEMAQIWMMEYGLLEQEEAKMALEMKRSRQLHDKTGTPVKSAMPLNRLVTKSPVSNGKSNKVAEPKGKRKREYSSDDDDLIAMPVKGKLKP